MLPKLIARLRAVLLRRRIAGEIDEELHDHIERETAANVAGGLTPSEARRRALADLGGLTQTRESTHAVRRSWLAAASQVLSFRALRRQPLYVASFVLTLMLAVATATTMGTVIKPVIFDPLPYGDDSALVMVNTSATNGFGPVNIHTLNDLRATAPPVMAITAARGASGSYTTPDGVFPVNLILAEPNYFATLGVAPAAGRFWSTSETNGVVVSWAFWQRSLNGDQAAIGQHITIDGIDRVVLGILPRNFVAPWNPTAEVWTPLDPKPLLDDPFRARRMLMVVARRAPGRSLEDVNAHLGVFSARMAREHQNVPGGQTLVAAPLRERLLGPTRNVIRGMAAATLLLFLIVAANIAGLAAVRAIALRRQTAVKIALGASRRRIVGERLGESALLAVIGSLGGVAGLSGAISVRARTARFVSVARHLGDCHGHADWRGGRCRAPFDATAARQRRPSAIVARQCR
jgi:putative ABC transport system permease protein